MDLGKELRELQVEPVEWPAQTPVPQKVEEKEPVEVEEQ
jgi:hypothetical protein